MLWLAPTDSCTYTCLRTAASFTSESTVYLVNQIEQGSKRWLRGNACVSAGAPTAGGDARWPLLVHQAGGHSACRAREDQGVARAAEDTTGGERYSAPPSITKACSSSNTNGHECVSHLRLDEKLKPVWIELVKHANEWWDRFSWAVAISLDTRSSAICCTVLLLVADAEEAQKMIEWRAQASKELEDWYKHRNQQLDKTKGSNRLVACLLHITYKTTCQCCIV